MRVADLAVYLMFLFDYRIQARGENSVEIGKTQRIIARVSLCTTSLVLSLTLSHADVKEWNTMQRFLLF